MSRGTQKRSPGSTSRRSPAAEGWTKSEAYYTSATPADAAKPRQNATPAKSKRRILRERILARWKIDMSVAQWKASQTVAADVFARKTRQRFTRPLIGWEYALPGLLKASTAANTRRDILADWRGLHRDYRRRAEADGRCTHCLMVVIIDPRWQLPVGSLAELRLDHVRRTALRWIRKLPSGCLATGFIELAVREDGELRGPSTWVPHLNLVISLPGTKSRKSLSAVKAAFPVRAHDPTAVYVPKKVKEVWWLRGALLYISKGLQQARVERRVAQVDGRPRKTPLRADQRDELICFYAGLKARNLLLLPDTARKASEIRA